MHITLADLIEARDIMKEFKESPVLDGKSEVWYRVMQHTNKLTSIIDNALKSHEVEVTL